MLRPAQGRAASGIPTPAPETVRLAGLGNRVVELFARKLSRQDLAGEIARLIALAASVKAVAILGFDARRDRLSLLGEHGLPRDAQAALGGGGDCLWDIPVRGLRNRRISVIAAAHQNPFVPRALVNVSPGGLSIASLPIYDDREPTGVLLLLAAGNRAFPDAQLQTLSQALRVCARGLRDLDSTAVHADAAARDTATIAAAIAELAGETAPDAAAADAPIAVRPIAPVPPDERVQRLEERLAQAHENLERTAIRLSGSTVAANAVVRERDRLAQRIAELESERESVIAELRAELDMAQERLLAVESERGRAQRIADDRHTRAQQAIKGLGTERDALLERVQASESRATELDGALAAVKGERVQLNAQIENLRGQVRASQDGLERAQARHIDERRTIESDREGWKEEAAALRGQLTERTEALAALDRELRSATVARDGATAQLQAAHAELERLTALNEEAGRAVAGSASAQASAAAEAATLRRALDAAHAEHTTVEHQLRGDLETVRADTTRLTGELDTARAELAARAQSQAVRDEELTRLRVEHARTQDAETAGQQARNEQRAEITTLAAKLEQLAAERQQLLDERGTLRVALAASRQQTTEADVAHVAAVAELQSDATQLRRQVETLTADRETLAGRLERAVEQGKTLTRGIAETQRHSEDLTELLRQRDAAAEAAMGEREQLAAQVAALTGQLQAGQEAWQRAHARAVHEQASLEADRDEWKAQASTARKELAQVTDRVIVLEGEVHGALAARDATAAELQAAGTEMDRLSVLNDELGHRIVQLDAAQAAAVVENTGLRRTLGDERSARVTTEQTLQRTLAVTQAEAERFALDATALRAELGEHAQALAERDQQLTGLRNEIELLRQQSVDRGVLAHQANELGVKVVALEQELVAARADGTRADRQRAALTETLEAGRRRETELLADAAREQAALQETLQALTAERDRLQADTAAHEGEREAQQLTITELHATLERLRGERTHAQDAQHDTARRLAATQRQLDEASAALRQREAEVATQSGERQRLAAQLDQVLREARAGQQALETAQARYTQERAASATERDRWKDQAAAAHSENERLARALEERSQTAAALDTARATAQAERAALLEALQTERATAELLRTERAALHTEVERLASDAAGLRSTVVERDEQLAAVREHATALQHGATELQQGITGLQANFETVTAQLEERTVEVQQLRDGQAALERQLTLVVATHGEEEQALAGGMQAAREQVAQLEQERTLLRATLGELRQQLSTAQTAEAAQRTEAHADAAQLRKQIKSLTAQRTNLTKRVEQAEKAIAEQAERADTTGRRTQMLDEQTRQLQGQLDTAQSERATLDAELVHERTERARLAAQLQDGAAERDRLRDERRTLERQLAQLSASAGDQAQALSEQLDAARAQGLQLEQDRATLQAALVELEQRRQQAATTDAAALAAVQSDADTLRDQVAELRTARDALREQLAQAEHAAETRSAQLDTEGRRAVTLAEQNTQLQQALAAAEQRQTALDGVLKQARTEIDALRQQSEDRGVLAHEASELGARVVELEQQLVSSRGEAAQAERLHAALAEELEAVRRQQAEADAAAGREQAKLRATAERLTEERRRLESDGAARAAEVESQRLALAELQAALARAEDSGQVVAQHLAETQRRGDELGGQLRQREAALEAVHAERQHLTSQLTKLTARARTSQEALDAIQGRAALERAALDAEREASEAKLAAGRDELQQVAALNEALTLQVEQLESGRTTAASEAAAQRRTLEELRATHRQAEETLHAEIAAIQSEAQRVSSDLLALRGELAERDAQLTLLRQEHHTAQQSDAERQQMIAGLRSQLAASNAHAQHAAAECQQLGDERATLQRQLALIEAARGEEAGALTQGLQAARAQIAQLEQERADARAGLAEVRQRLARAESIHAETQARMQTETKELQQQVTALSEARAALAQRVEHTEQALRRQSEQAEAESRRALALAERGAELEQSLAAAESQRATLGTDVQRMAGEIAALRHESADRGTLARQTSELHSAIGTLEQQLAEMRRHAAHAEHQRAAVAEELEAARQEQTRALAAAEQQHTTLQAMLQELTDERARLVAEHTTQQHQLETQRITMAEVQAALEQTQADRQRFEEDGRDTAQRLADVHRRMEELSQRLRQRDTALEGSAAERQRLEDAIQAAEAQVAELSSERDTWRQQAESAGAGSGRLTDPAVLDDDFVVRMSHEDAAPPADAPLVIERSAPLDELLDAAPEPADIPPPEPAAEAQDALRLAKEMVLLDASGRGDEAYNVLKGAGFEVTRAVPNEAAVDDLASRKISCVMLNLAAGPAAWRMLKTLRERTGTRSIPILAYLMAPDSQKGFCFGRADFGIWPMDGERLTERLTHLRPKLKRLLAVSADIDGIGRLRDPLAKAGISTSSVLDGKQALEFATMVQPEAALFHVSPNCAGVVRAITALRAGEVTRDLPMMVLLDKTPPREDAFYAVTARELISKGMFVFANLPAELARLLA